MVGAFGASAAVSDRPLSARSGEENETRFHGEGVYNASCGLQATGYETRLTSRGMAGLKPRPYCSIWRRSSVSPPD